MRVRVRSSRRSRASASRASARSGRNARRVLPDRRPRGFDRLADTDLLYLDGPYVDAEYRGRATPPPSDPAGSVRPAERVTLEEPTASPR
jgi:hypothetical protein